MCVYVHFWDKMECGAVFSVVFNLDFFEGQNRMQKSNEDNEITQ